VVPDLPALGALVRPQIPALAPLVSAQLTVRAVGRAALVALMAAKVTPLVAPVAANLTPALVPVIVISAMLAHAAALLPAEVTPLILFVLLAVLAVRPRVGARPEHEHDDDNECAYRPLECTDFKSHPLIPPSSSCRTGEFYWYLTNKAPASLNKTANSMPDWKVEVGG